MQVIINEDNIADIQAEYDGPSGTPYEGGLFKMKLVIGSDFPGAPPKGTHTHIYSKCIVFIHSCMICTPDVLYILLFAQLITGYFLTKLFHPNVSSNGEICVNVLKRDWTPDLGLRHIFTVIRCLLIEPNAESALNEEAGKLLLESFDDFAKKAKLMTDIHAKKPTVLTAAGGANAVNSDNGSSESKNSTGNSVASMKHKGGLGGRAGIDKKRSLKRL